MCGFLAVFGASCRNFNEAFSSIQHRGPDSSKVVDLTVRGLPVILGHHRLSIVDDDAGSDQPFVSACGRYYFLFNGEIYNYIELRAELITKGVKLKTQSDTEVLFQGLLNSGESFLHKCNGMWSYVIWDSLQKKVTFGRDRFGVKPLYYCKLGEGTIAFASEQKALMILLPAFSKSEYFGKMCTNLFGYEASEHTLVNEIKRVRAGNTGSWIPGGEVKTNRWWNTLDHITYAIGGVDRISAEWKDLFIDCVKIRTRCAVNYGTALSGGLDSSCILAALVTKNASDSQSTKRPHKAFTCTYEGNELDESKYSKMVAEHFGVPLSLVSVNGRDEETNLKQTIYYTEDPYLTYGSPMIQLYRKMKSSGISVSIDGHGADELLSGYTDLSSVILDSKNLKQLREIVAIEESLKSGIYTESYRRSIRRYLHASFRSLLADVKSNRYFGYKQNILRPLYQDELDSVYTDERFLELSLFNKLLYELYHYSVLPTLLRNYDRYSMAAGLEIRMPFMDFRLVSYTFSLDNSFKIGGGFTKRILRDSFRKELPEKVVNRRNKVGWNCPITHWLKDGLYDQLISLCGEGIDSDTRSMLDAAKLSESDLGYSQSEYLWKRLQPYLSNAFIESFKN